MIEHRDVVVDEPANTGMQPTARVTPGAPRLMPDVRPSMIEMGTNDLIGRYLLAAAEHWEAQRNLGTPSALGQGNRAANELRRLATEIGERGSTHIRAFSALLDESRNGVNGWAVFHILEVMTAPPDVVDRAFETLERLALGDDILALGTRMRLRELRSRFGRASRD